MIQLLENLNDYEPSVQIYLYFLLIIDNSVWNYTSFTEFHTNVGISIFKRIYFEMSYSLLAISMMRHLKKGIFKKF